jgi:hypothetical protein
MKDQLRQIWREASLQEKRDTADAMKLPWAECSEVIGGVLGFFGILLGLLFSFPAALGGGLIAYLLGRLLGLLLHGTAWMLPTPFAWLSRRLGYAR